AAQPVELDLKRFRGRVPVELLGRATFPPIGDLPYLLTLPAYGFYWFRLAQDVAAPDWHKEMLVHEEAPVLVLFDGWLSFFRDKVVPWRIGMAEQLRERLEVEVLPKFIEGQRWYAQKGEPVKDAHLRDHVVWDVGGLSWLLALVSVRDTVYFLPLALGWEEDEDHVRALSALAVAKVRQQANVGVMADALADEAFCRHVVKAIGEKKTIATTAGTLRFAPTSQFAKYAGEEVATLTLGTLHTQSTNTSVTLGDRLFLKCFRRIRHGMHPELEVGRFLTEVAHFKNCVPLLGTVEYQPAGGGETAAIALLQVYMPNQGDAWNYTLAYLERVVEGLREDETHGAYLTLIQTLATRTAELHRAFATPSRDDAFAPEPLGAQDVEAWRGRVRQEAEETLRIIEKSEKASALAAQRARILAFIERCAAPKRKSLKTRHHGDYHLGQVLVSNNDFLIIDFEGEPSRPLADSRKKHTPLRDVAGMLRSFSYARGSTELHESTEPNIERVAPALQAWERATRQAFLQAYAAAMAGSGIYDSFDDMRGVLQLAEIEKVLYELRYEAANRPDWIHIPVQGLLALLEGG
ncbi:MAG: putative maltokinase, partial [Burkholderiales bacterium]